MTCRRLFLELRSLDQAVDHLERLAGSSDGHFVATPLDGDELEAAAGDLVTGGVTGDLVVVAVRTGVAPRVPGLFDGETHAAGPALAVSVRHTCYRTSKTFNKK